MVFKFNVNKGVTLIELLIVTVIISIISGVIIIGTRSSTSDIELFNAKNTIVANINKAKEMALAGISAEEGQDFKVGVQFNDAVGKVYSIIREDNTILEKIELPRGIEYNAGDCEKVLFIPPTPVVELAKDCKNFEISVCKEKDPSKCHTIKVNKAGLVE